MTLQGHTVLYGSSPPLPEIEHPNHLKPSVYRWLRINRAPIDLVTDEEDDEINYDVTLADLLRKKGTSTAQEVASLLGGDLLPNHPKGPRITAQKCKATIFLVDDDDEQPR